MQRTFDKETLVSIITPIHNGEHFINETIQSVLAQTHPNWEMIIINDNSSDASLERIHSSQNLDSRIKVINSKKHIGAAKARNIGFSESTGRYIAFLDADDIWLPTKIEEQIAFMQSNDCPFCFSAYQKINKSGKQIGTVGIPEITSYKDLLKTNVIGCLTVILDTQYFGEIKTPVIQKRQDYALWLQLLKKAKIARGINRPLAQYRIHGKNHTNNKLNAAIYTWKLFRHIEKLPLPQCIYYFSHYAVRGLLRNKLPRIALALGVMKHTR